MIQDKYHLPPLIIVIIVLFILSLLPFILRKQIIIPPFLPFHLEWSEKYKNGSVEIAGFTEGENWIGDYTLDSERSLDGNTGLNLYAQNGKSQEIKLQKEMNLTSFDSILATIYVDNENFAKQTNSFILNLITDDNKQYTVPLSPLQRGWNLLSLPLFTFTDASKNRIQNMRISVISFKLSGLQKQTAQVTLDRLWAEKFNKPYLSQLSSLNPISTSFKTIAKHTFLNLFSSGINRLSPVQFKQSTQFTATCKVIPESKGSFGFFIKSEKAPESEISFLISHENKWTLEKNQSEQKQNRTISGSLQEFYNISTPFWLRIMKQNDTLSVEYSTNGTQYKQIITNEKIEIDTASFGLLSDGAFLLDYVDIKP